MCFLSQSVAKNAPVSPWRVFVFKYIAVEIRWKKGRYFITPGAKDLNSSLRVRGTYLPTWCLSGFAFVTIVELAWCQESRISTPRRSKLVCSPRVVRLKYGRRQRVVIYVHGGAKRVYTGSI